LVFVLVVLEPFFGITTLHDLNEKPLTVAHPMLILSLSSYCLSSAYA